AGLARAAAGHADDAVVPAADADRGQRAFLLEERVHRPRQRLPLLVLARALGAVGRGRLGHGELLQALERGGVVAVRVGLGAALVLARLAQQQHLAAQLAAVLPDV